MSTGNNGQNPYGQNPYSNSGQPYRQPRPIRPKTIGTIAGIIAGVIFALIIVFNSVYSLTENQNAVVTTLGNPSAVTTSGIHFAIPFIQKVHIVDMTVHGLAIGYDEKSNQSIEYESLMITSDFNFLDVSCYIEYAVSDPIKYLYNAKEPETILKMLAQSYIRDLDLFVVFMTRTDCKGTASFFNFQTFLQLFFKNLAFSFFSPLARCCFLKCGCKGSDNF
ncbi:MAG: hypothetical protein IJ990_00380 [Alistipes sp.]|nr:hypothetical protein [Alistipes sp.]